MNWSPGRATATFAVGSVAAVAISRNRDLSHALLHIAGRMPLIKRFVPHLEEFYESTYLIMEPRGVVLAAGGFEWNKGLWDSLIGAPIEAPAAGPNTPAPPAHNGKAYWIKLSAKTDGSFTVTNARNKFTKEYSAPK